MTETGILSKITARAKGLITGNGIVTGIGDDCAIFRQPGAKHDLVFTTDMMHEGVHFTWDEPAANAGWRALARSISDCAAMGARPLFCLVSVSFPANAAAWLDDFYKGIVKHKLVLAGGDLSATPYISCDVMVCGEVPRGKALLRSAAKPGDRICVSGPLGRAALALDTRGSYLPKPRVELGIALREAGVKCAMDLSDGLSMDLARLCQASGVGAELHDVPVAKGAGLHHALHGGEDYELLFTVPPKLALPNRVHEIGIVTRGSHVLYHGQLLEPLGWDHFRRS
ncbi:MAG: thiamine-phosphate kinase [Acidobacteria bacterium]|nr:thiamine-phosphate kinase [Acidobacteriota bacterium]